MPKFDLIIFDMDGVIANTTPSHERAYSDLWHKIGVEGPCYEIIAGRKTIDVITEIVAEQKLSDSQIGEWVIFKQLRAREYLSTETILYNDTISCLEGFSHLCFQMAIATGASKETTAIILKRLKEENLFSTILTAEDVTHGKPSPEIYEKVILQTRIEPEKTLIIEDSFSGLKAAIASKAFVASVRTGNEISNPKFIGSFLNLQELLGKMQNSIICC